MVLVALAELGLGLDSMTAEGFSSLNDSMKLSGEEGWQEGQSDHNEVLMSPGNKA